MRIRIMFDDYPDEVPELENLEIWIDFPCRINNNDMILDNILGDYYKNIMKDYYVDNPIVICNSFDTDKNGIYQNVWLKV